MAIVKYGEGSTRLKRTDRLPKRRYAIRCINEEFGESKSSGNPMITLEWEIVWPETVDIDGRTVEVGGTDNIMQYFSFNPTDEKKRNSAVQAYLDICALLNVPQDGLDTDNPTLVLKGIVADATLYAKDKPELDDPTPEERKEGKKAGKPTLDSNGKAIINFEIKINQILGVSTQEINRAY